MTLQMLSRLITKNNRKVHLLFSNNCHNDAMVPYNDEEELKDQQVTDQECKSVNFSIKAVSSKAYKKYEEKLILNVHREDKKYFVLT